MILVRSRDLLRGYTNIRIEPKGTRARARARAKASKMRLAHLHLPNITQFARVSNIQETLTTRLLTYKKLATTSPATTPVPSPDPTIITFTPNPVYTTGRRDLPPSNTNNRGSGSPETQIQAELSLPPSLEPIRSILTPAGTYSSSPDAEAEGTKATMKTAEYHPTLRGGQTTYHGPGQMVAYTVLDLRRLGLSPRCHIRLLENSVVDVLAGFGVKGVVTEDPGVWVAGSGAGAGAEKKITAVGVHLRRNISSYGVGFNVTEEPMWFFRQIVACGLEGKETTSLQGQGVNGVSIGEVAEQFVQAFTKRVNSDFACGQGARGERIDEVYKIQESDLL